MFCSKCGAKLADGSRFCGQCGHVVGGEVEVGENPSSKPCVQVGKRRKLVGVCAGVVALIVVIVFAASMGVMGFAPAVKGSLEEYSWDELSAISEKISETTSEDEAVEIAKKYNLVNAEGKLDGSQSKEVKLEDGTVVSVQIAGFLHDDKADGGKAGITFIFNNHIPVEYSGYMNSKTDADGIPINAGGWEASEMRAILAREGMALLPDDLREHVVEVAKLSNNVGETDDASSVTALLDKLWLFSAVELYGEFDSRNTGASASVLNSEGKKYKLFRDCGVTSESMNMGQDVLKKVIPDESHEPWSWFGRSAYPYDTILFLVVYTDEEKARISEEDGAFPNALTFGDAAGPVPGFCI